MASAAQKSIKSISYAKYGYMFIAPFFIVYCIFQLWPLINTFRLSFYGNGKTLETFVGLKNFQNILFGSETSIPAQAIHEEFFNYFLAGQLCSPDHSVFAAGCLVYRCQA